MNHHVWLQGGELVETISFLSLRAHGWCSMTSHTMPYNQENILSINNLVCVANTKPPAV